MTVQDTNCYASSAEGNDPCSNLATSIKNAISKFPCLSPDCCIFRAPNTEQQFNKAAFSPVMVSIGPFHHGSEHLQSMEKLKVGYLGAFLSRANISLESCIRLIKQLENRVRNCYAEPIEFSSDDFVKMILLDSCFVIEVIWWENNADHREEAIDPLNRPSVVLDVRADMMLIENQLPFFVLEDLFNLAFPKSVGTSRCFINLCLEYFKTFLLSGDSDLAKRNVSHHQQTKKIKHLLDLVRLSQAPSILRRNPKGYPTETSMRKATELDEAGMVIKPGTDYKSGIDIKYAPGILEIPKLQVVTFSECVLRNLMALESYLYRHDSFISDYIHFMDNLIDTSEDVELLVRNGVLESFASDSHQVANLFNNLRPWCSLKNYYYYGIQEEVNAYCKIPCHKWRANLRRDYCSSPWMITSTIAAIILLLLTFIQTVCSILSMS